MKIKKFITILVSSLLLMSPIKVKAADLPSVGVVNMIDNITEDQAKWAYAKELGEQLQSEELRLLTAIIWCEAGNQCEAGKQAVGIVVMNRVENELFKDTIEEVIYEPGQFRPKTDGTLNKALKIYDTGEIPTEWTVGWQECVEAAKYALSGLKTVIYKDKEIDMNEYLYFARDLKNEKVRIQDHDFK